jgi:hypothetical protein
MDAPERSLLAEYQQFAQVYTLWQVPSVTTFQKSCEHSLRIYPTIVKLVRMFLTFDIPSSHRRGHAEPH